MNTYIVLVNTGSDDVGTEIDLATAWFSVEHVSIGGVTGNVVVDHIVWCLKKCMSSLVLYLIN